MDSLIIFNAVCNAVSILSILAMFCGVAVYLGSNNDRLAIMLSVIGCIVLVIAVTAGVTIQQYISVYPFTAIDYKG